MLVLHPLNEDQWPSQLHSHSPWLVCEVTLSLRAHRSQNPQYGLWMIFKGPQIFMVTAIELTLVQLPKSI